MLCVCHVLDSDTFSSLAYGSSVFGRMSSILSFRSQMHWRRETTDHSASNKCQTLIVLHTHSHTLLHTHTPVESWNISDVIINYTELCGIDTTDLPEYTYERNKGNIRTAQHCKIKICFDFFVFAFFTFLFSQFVRWVKFIDIENTPSRPCKNGIFYIYANDSEDDQQQEDGILHFSSKQSR